MSGKKMEFIEEINQSLKSILIEANSLTIEEHIFTQAKFQGYIDGGISKTINLPNSATVDDIKNAIMLAKENSCVGISLYRNGSLQGQPTQMVG
jgi:ribonucleoside-diphosphate reductase alpha chain